MEALGELPRSDLSEPCPYVLGKGSVDAYPCHAVTGVAEPFKPRRCLTVPLKAGRVAGFHVDRYDVPRVVALGIPETTMTVLHAGILHLL